MKKTILFFYCLLVLTISQGQNKNFTMEEAVLGLRGNLAPQNLNQLTWLPDGKTYVQIVNMNGKQDLVKTFLPSFKTETVLEFKQFAEIFKANNLPEPKRWPLLNWHTENEYWFSYQNAYWQYNLLLKKLEKWMDIPLDGADFDFYHEKRYLAYTNGQNLRLRTDKDDLAITAATDDGIVYGKPAHRSEFGITKGTFWSPNGNKLAFYEINEKAVTKYPITTFGEKALEVNYIRYPFAGDSSHQARIGVYDVKTKKTIFLETDGPYDQYLTNIVFSPDEKFVYVAIVNRGQDTMTLKRFSSETGKLNKTLFTETNERFIEPENPPLFLPKNPDWFVWQTKKDGFNHLYLYHNNGKEIRQLTKGQWSVLEVFGLTADGNGIVFSANKTHPLSQGIYATDIKNGQIQHWADSKGIHNFNGNLKTDNWFDTHQGPGTPRSIILKSKGKAIKTLLDAKNPLVGYATAQVTEVNLKADDGTPLYGKLMLPANFDSTKKYPVLVYLYGGSHLQLVRHTWPESGNLWYDLLTQKGFIVFTMDNRGSSNRGLAFEQATFRQLGKVEMDDQLKGVAFLQSLPFVDAKNMGVHGWSFGGFMTTSLMLHHPDVFKVGIAGGPVIDWGLYEIMYTERYMDKPNENPEGYKNTNLINFVGNLKGKLLQIHGTEDDVVVWQHTQAFLAACIKAGIQLDYFLYPEHEHNVIGKDRVHLMEKVTNYLLLHLPSTQNKVN